MGSRRGPPSLLARIVRTTLLDTGPIVGWLRAGDPDHGASVAALIAAGSRGSLATIWEVIGEAYTVIRYRADAEAARRVLDWADTVDRIPVDDLDHSRTHALLRRHRDLRISYVDALLLAVAERRKADEVLTLDAELRAVKLRPSPVVTVLSGAAAAHQLEPRAVAAQPVESPSGA